jgi:hypothetical protein
MKVLIITLVFFAINQSYFFSQDLQSSIKSTAGQKGTFYFYWGWNRGAYSKSDIQFTGASYDFTLSDVKASDRQSAFDPKVYFGLTKFTIPQYNFRMGYYINEHYQVSLGADHMKYVMVTNQLSTIDGSIANSGTSYDGTYDQQSFVIKPNFLLFEHTDGLNYLNSEFRRSDVLINKKYFQVSVNEGLGIGVLVPKTNTTLLNNPRYDEFHLSGVGFGGVAALNLTFFKYLIIQSELKGGFISMPDIRTTMNEEDRASQHFWWTQFNVVFGLQFPIIKKSVKKAGVIFD